MTVLTLASLKGGTGKSTVGENLSVAWAHQGGKVCIVEADETVRSVAKWHGARTMRDNYGTSEVPALTLFETHGNINHALRDLGREHDFVVVDTAGKDSREMRTGMIASDIVLIPMGTTQKDLESLDELLPILEQARDLNPALRALVVLNQVDTNVFETGSKAARGYLAEFPEVQLLESYVYDRVAYQNVDAEGLGVVEWTDRKARAEIRELAGELMA
jgi:chromosome partitioning protein